MRIQITTESSEAFILGFMEQERECRHDWYWTLRDGSLWGEPCNLNAYDADLIIGRCLKCGAVHQPEKVSVQ